MQKDSRVQSESTGLSVSSDGSTGRIQVLKSSHFVYIWSLNLQFTIFSVRSQQESVAFEWNNYCSINVFSCSATLKLQKKFILVPVTVLNFLYDSWPTWIIRYCYRGPQVWEIWVIRVSSSFGLNLIWFPVGCRMTVWNLYMAPRISEPVWLSMISQSTERNLLCQRFLKEMSLLMEHGAKSQSVIFNLKRITSNL